VSKRGHLDLARFLIEHGANAAAQDQDGLTPSHVASNWGHLDFAQFLVGYDANSAAQTTLHIQQSTIT
jgi:ankyrin repeat protein